MNTKCLKTSFLPKLGVFIAVFLLLTMLLYWLVADDWERTAVITDSVSMNQLLPESTVIKQSFTSNMDNIEQITIVPHFDAKEQPVSVMISLFDQDTLLLTQTVDTSALVSDVKNQIKLDPMVSDVKDHMLTLEITQAEGAGILFWSGNMVSAGKFDVVVQTSGLTVNGESCEGELVLSLIGHDVLQASRWIWPIALVILAAAVGVICLTHCQRKKGKQTILTMAVTVYHQYYYLLRQLVVRDFRVKYKSSSLGMLWSLLNPLLTMAVYLFVFSTLFKSDIPDFPVYLISGIVIFNYFSESTSLGLVSIIGNSALITKVYMPKLIYPLSKVLSAAINLCITLIPLCLVMVITGVPFQKSILLLPLVVGFMIIFSFGMSLILATMNVFFRDTQFLWSVLLMMINFLTPVFYPESIIPDQFLLIYRMNPLYQILFFARTIIINGVSPTPITYLYCVLSCGLMLVLGLWIFRRNQDRFVLYL